MKIQSQRKLFLVLGLLGFSGLPALAEAAEAQLNPLLHTLPMPTITLADIDPTGLLGVNVKEIQTPNSPSSFSVLMQSLSDPSLPANTSMNKVYIAEFNANASIPGAPVVMMSHYLLGISQFCTENSIAPGDLWMMQVRVFGDLGNVARVLQCP